jgi:hypothetical protein
VVSDSVCQGVTKEAYEMRGLRKKGDGRWHDVVERRVHFTEHKIRRQASDPMRGVMLLGERVDDATSN